MEVNEVESVKKPRRGLKIAAGVTTALALVLGGSGAAYGVYYQDKALPTVTLQGQKVSGLDEAAITDMLTKGSAGKELTLKLPTGEVKATYADLGIETDVPATVNAVFAPNQSFLNRFTALFKPVNVDVVTKVDEAKLNSFVVGLEKKLAKPRVDAKLEFNAETAEFSVVPGSAGEVVDKADFLTQVKEQAAKYGEEALTLKIVSEDPDVTDAEANQFKEKADQLKALNVVFFEGEEDITVPAEKLATLISIADGSGKTVEPHFDEAKVREYVSALSVETNEDPEPALHNVNSKGAVVQVATEGKPGWKVNNAAAVADAAIAALKEGKDFRGEFTYDKIAQPVETRLIADGAENLPYKAAPGERWIDINLSTLTMTAYEGATPVFVSNQIVPGAAETPTVTGKFAVYLKYNTQDMRGTNVDGTPYLTKGVPWVTYFHLGYAIHGAPWRSHFGFGYAYGSHGCVNTPVDHAKFIYDWSQMGDPVLVHY